MNLFLDKVFGDRGRTFTDKFTCPYKLCPSNMPIDGSKAASMKFIQRISPRVYQYRCRHCGCLLNKGEDGPSVPVEMWAHHTNSRLVNKDKSYNLRHW